MQINSLKKVSIAIICLVISAGLKAQQIKHYSRTVKKTEKKLNKIAKSRAKGDMDGANSVTPDLYWIQEFIATMNPELKRPTPEVLLNALDQLNSSNKTLYGAMPGASVTPWVERGPNNVGGRTRALAWDPWSSNGKKVWAGGITGGLWYNDDITNANSSWQHVSSLWGNLSISAIAFDPVNAGTIYVGTGEGYGSNTSTSRGYGIWKSTDSGQTFNRLTNTSTYYYVNDLVVRNESGNSVVYAAVDANYFGGNWQGLTSYGLFRSTNGGSSWTNVIPNAANSAKYAIADLELDASNNLWAGTRENPYSGTDKGGGRVLFSSSGTSWTVKYTLTGRRGRVELACAPQNANLVYAVFEYQQKCDTILVTHNAGGNWSKLAKPSDADLQITKWDFTRNQAWYDLIMAVDPNDTNTLVLGGIDLFRSTNGGSSWSQISKWSNNKNLNTLNCSYVHADQHEIAFKPGSSSTCIFGCDGGVFYTSNLASAASSNVISERNKDYITSQFYWGDLAATKGSNYLLGGMQDNGSVVLNSSGLGSGTAVTGGDGGNCFISPSNGNKQITSYVYNNYYYTTNGWSGSGNLIADGATGKFINPADWDDNGSGLFTGKSAGAIYRIKLTSGPGSLQTVTWTASGAPSSIDAFPVGSKTRLFVGTDAGKLYVTQDAWATSPSFTDITGTINAGNISDVYNLNSGDTIAVVLSNYGVSNVYVSTDAGTTWKAKDGTLPDQPVWSIILNPDKAGEAVIATETGVYGTTNIFASSPTWSAYTEGMGAVKVATLRYRSSDKTLMAVTHGRGLFTSDAWGRNTPIPYFGVSSNAICSNQSISLIDSTLNDPNQWLWSITPPYHQYINGTDSTSQNPEIRFAKGGTFSIKLTASNQLGSSFLTRSSIVTVTDTIAGTAILVSSADTLCAGDSLNLTALVNSKLSGSITNYKWQLGSNTVNNTDSTFKLLPSNGQSFQVTMSSSAKCVSPAIIASNQISIVVLPVLNPALQVTPPAGCTGRPMIVPTSGSDLGSNPIYDWYLDNSLQSSHGSTLTIASPVSGSKLYAQVLVDSKCAKPSNLIKSNTATLVVNTTPSDPMVSRNYDTLFASHSGGGTFTWYLNGQFSGSGKVYRAPANGTYKCIYTENNCASDSSQALVFNSLNTSGVNPLLGNVYPIPAHGVIHIKEFSEIQNLVLVNSAGKLLDCAEISKNIAEQNGLIVYTVTLDISQHAAGNYFLRYQTVTGKKEIPIIIK